MFLYIFVFYVPFSKVIQMIGQMKNWAVNQKPIHS